MPARRTTAIAPCLVIAMLLVAAGCSVSTPRHGLVAGSAGQLGAARADTGAAEVAGVESGTTDALGSAAGPSSSAGPLSSGRATRATTSGAATAGGSTAGRQGDRSPVLNGPAPGVTPTSVAISLTAPFSGTYGPIISQVV